MTSAERALLRHAKQNTGFVARALSELERMDIERRREDMAPKYRVVPIAEARARVRERLGLE